ncbi:MAG: hypothetical protein U0Y82_15930 [Thermoleophilia bacterium]
MSPPSRSIIPTGTPTVEDVQRHCHRVRSAGSPNAKARSALVNDYRRLCAALSVQPEETATNLDLQKASAVLLRAAAAAEAAATRTGRPRR